MTPDIVVVCASLLTGLLFTKLIRNWSPQLGLVDKPDSRRKIHRDPTPLGGGLAVYLSTVLILLVLWMFSTSWNALLTRDQKFLTGLLSGASLITLIGVMDDAWELRGRQKLLGQILATALLTSFGVVIEKVQLFDWTVELGLLSVPFTMFWMLGAINAINLLDGIDGLAGSIGIIICIALAAMAFIGGRETVAIIAIVFALSLAGFLRYNFPPASIFLGDAGSLLIGFMIGALSIQASLKGAGTLLLAAPLAILTIPILDSGAAILRRKLSGRSIYVTDRGHIHHVLTARFGNRGALGWIALSSVAMALAALVSIWLQSDLVALICVAALLVLSIVTRSYGHTEAKLLARRITSILRSILAPRHPRQDQDSSWELTVHLQGNRAWQAVWQHLIESSRNTSILELELDLNMPAIHEGFVASWKRDEFHRLDDVCKLSHPLYFNEQRIGTLQLISGSMGNRSRAGMEELKDVLTSFEKELEDFITRQLEPTQVQSAGVPSPHYPQRQLQSATHPH